MRVSIVVCTFNRAGLLPGLLARLDEELAGVDGEIVVVDNGSTDETAQVVAHAAARQRSPLRYVLEEKQGLSHARNRGVRESSADAVVFIDDDALPDGGWLGAHLTAYGADARIGTVGGPIGLRFLGGARPRWLGAAFEQMLGRYELGPLERDYDDGSETPSGGNFSVLRAALDEVGLFDVELGRTGDDLGGGEEYELAHRLFAHGWRGVYRPAARVEHLIPAERLRLRYFRDRLRWNWSTTSQLSERGFGTGASSPRLVALSLVGDLAGLVRSRSFSDAVFHLLRIEATLRAQVDRR